MGAIRGYRANVSIVGIARLRDLLRSRLPRRELAMNYTRQRVAPTGALLGHPSRRRDTADACRDRMASGTKRDLLERSAAAWSMRAEQLERQEARLALEALGAVQVRC